MFVFNKLGGGFLIFCFGDCLPGNGQVGGGEGMAVFIYLQGLSPQ